MKYAPVTLWTSREGFMGIMICQHHGRVEFVETCSHAAKRIDERKPPNGRRLTVLGHLLVCDECYSSLGLERFESLASLPLEEAIEVDDGRWEAYETAYALIEGRRAFCVECVAELERQYLTA